MAEVEIVDAPPPAAPPPPTSEIHIEPSTATDIGPIDTPRPGSAKERMFQELRKKAKDPAEPPGETPKTADKPKPAVEKPNRPGAMDEPEEKEESPDAPKAEVPKAAEKPMSAEEKKRVNPWKLVDDYKARTSKLEKEISELRTSALPQKEREELTKKMESIELRNKELEDHMRFVDYSRSAEFKQKFDEPYEKAWMVAMKELGELRISDESGEERPIAPADILELVNLPLPKARERAEELYGSFADDVMAQRKEIRNLFEARNQALEDAKKNGESRVKQNMETFQKQMGEMSKIIKETWDQSNEAILRDEKYGLYFTPVEGDENVNQRLAKGYELVDRAFTENPNDPRLSADERKAIIKRHAAVRNRAAAFGRLVYDLTNAHNKIKELTDELSKFRGSEPPTGGGARPTGADGKAGYPTSAKESIFAALRAKAR